MAFNLQTIKGIQGIQGISPYWPLSRTGDQDEKQPKAKPGKKDEIARWNNHKFKVEKKSIHGFTGLQIKGSTETEDKVGSNQKFVSRKNSKPTEISLTALLDARFGCDVKTEAMQFVADAYNGCTDWFYMGASKLSTYKLMLTDATVKDVILSPKGKWISANVALTLKQCTQKNGSTAGVVEKSSSGDSDGGGSSGGGGGGGGGSSKKRSTKSGGTKKPKIAGKAGDFAKKQKEKEQASKAKDEIQKRKDQAQKSRQTGGGTGRRVDAVK